MKANNTQPTENFIRQAFRAPRRRRLLLVSFVVALSSSSFLDAGAARPGSLDPTFGAGGKVQVDFASNSDYGSDVVLQADGKIVVVGNSEVYPGFNSAIARLNSDGSLDAAFGNDGTVISHFNATDSLAAVTVQTDGKIVAVGSAQATSGNNGTDALLARFNVNGTLDSSFGTSGAVYHQAAGNIPVGWYFSASAVDVTVLADGRILVGGYTTTVSFGRMALLRYNSNGTLDQTFGDAGSFDIAYGVALASDGKIVLAGLSNGSTEGDFDFALSRYLP